MDSSSSWWYISLVVFLCMSFSLLPDTTHLHHSRQSVERQKVGPQKFVLNRNMQLLVLFFFLYCYKTVRMPFSIYHAKEKLVRLASSGYLIQHNVQFLFRFTLNISWCIVVLKFKWCALRRLKLRCLVWCYSRLNMNLTEPSKII